jgi:hypothetical protein
MGDRTWTSITFSGIISREVADELVEQLKDQGCYVDVGPEGDLSIEHLRMPHAQFYDEECNYAQMEGVEAYCQEHHITYFKSWSAVGDYGPGMEIYHAIADQIVQCANVDGEPVIELKQLIKAHSEGRIEDMIGYLKSFSDFEKNNPPLVIQDDVAAAA